MVLILVLVLVLVLFGRNRSYQTKIRSDLPLKPSLGVIRHTELVSPLLAESRQTGGVSTLLLCEALSDGSRGQLDLGNESRLFRRVCRNRPALPLGTWWLLLCTLLRSLPSHGCSNRLLSCCSCCDQSWPSNKTIQIKIHQQTNKQTY